MNKQPNEFREIIVNCTNRGRIAACIDTVQYKTRVRNIEVKDIFDFCNGLEDAWKRAGWHKTRMEGSTFVVDPNNQKFPNAYKGIPESTSFKVEFRGGKFRLTDVYRFRCHESYCLAFYSENAKTEILRAASTLTRFRKGE